MRLKLKFIAGAVGIALSLYLLFFIAYPHRKYKSLHRTRRPRNGVTYIKSHAFSEEPHVAYIVPRFHGRLGNTMFAYASALGIAHRCKAKTMLPSDHPLRMIFQISANNYSTKSIKKWTKLFEEHSGHYSLESEVICDQNTDVIELDGYFQSWRYFSDIEDVVLREFQFQNHLSSVAKEFISNATFDHSKSSKQFPVTTVGVHIRVGDLLTKENVGKGYRMANIEYFNAAFNYFTQRHSNILFIVCTDSIDWVLENIDIDKSRFVLSVGHTDAEDLAILSNCDHIIITVGTFGWWAAYLGQSHSQDQKVVYFANYAANNSIIDKEISAYDYFCKNWMPIK